MSVFLLKIIACASMLADHIGAVFSLEASEILRWTGRLAFPIYAYMIAQGCKHTKNIGKYLLRLGILAVISEIPFDMAFKSFRAGDNEINWGINFLRQTNIFTTLFLGAACAAAYEKIKIKMKIKIKAKNILAVLITVPLLFTAWALGVDYGAAGAGLIFLLYLANPRNKITRTIILAAWAVYFYSGNLFLTYGEIINGRYEITSRVINWDSAMYLIFALMSAVLIFFYNGRQGPKMKWAFYFFYPAHILILVILRNILYGL